MMKTTRRGFVTRSMLAISLGVAMGVVGAAMADGPNPFIRKCTSCHTFTWGDGESLKVCDEVWCFNADGCSGQWCTHGFVVRACCGSQGCPEDGWSDTCGGGAE